MRFNCGPTYEQRRKDLQEWHPWFAWHPVRVASNECVWLETVARRAAYFEAWEDTPVYEYRTLTKGSE